MQSKKIKLVVCDVDGTLTDGGMWLTSSGEHLKCFNAKDGMAAKILLQNDIQPALLSHSKTTEIVYNRAAMLNIKFCYAGNEDKSKILADWMDMLKLKAENVAFLGDDINDLDAMRMSGTVACPADAHSQVRQVAHHVLKTKGGEGCLREFVDEILQLDY